MRAKSAARKAASASGAEPHPRVTCNVYVVSCLLVHCDLRITVPPGGRLPRGPCSSPRGTRSSASRTSRRPLACPPPGRQDHRSVFHVHSAHNAFHTNLRLNSPPPCDHSLPATP